MIKKNDNYPRYPDDKEEDLLATSGIFRIIYRFLSHKITLREAVEEATALYEYRRNAAADARIKYLFFSVILYIVRLVDKLEQGGGMIYQKISGTISTISGLGQKACGFIKDGVVSSGRTAFAMPGVLFDLVRELFTSIKITKSEQKQVRKKRNKDLEIPRFVRNLLETNDEQLYQDLQEFLQVHRLSSFVRMVLKKLG